jgi:hypothetical protein
MVMATKKEAASAKVTVRPKGRKTWPMMPPMRPTGRKTATVVTVLAKMAMLTSRVPSTAARQRSSPRWMWR